MKIDLKIITILGTRPEIIKLSPLLPLLDQEFEHILIHTGQHYDHNMDTVFFEELKLKGPDYSLNIGSHSHGKQTGLMLEKIEEILIKKKPDVVIVLGDTNTTLAGALAASKLHVPLLHIEAGCRSFNRQMPEEINRVVADRISNYLIAPDKESFGNLLNEGISPEKISLFGSTVFEAVLRNKEFAKNKLVLDAHSLEKDNFVLVTLHRAENTDDLERFKGLVEVLNKISTQIKVVFPIHPRTKKLVEEQEITFHPNVAVLEPQPYLNFLALLSHCKLCLSDSGGIQEEALVFNVPCLIPREETEWMRLVKAGKNILVGTNPKKIVETVHDLLMDSKKLSEIKNKVYPFETGVSLKIVELIRGMRK